MSLEATAIALRIAASLLAHVEENELGGVFGSEASYQCFADAPTKVRRPDVSFIHRDRLREEYMQGHCPIAPDLVVEVVSPSDLYYEVYEKVEEYHSAGVRLIWVLNPQRQTVHVLPLRERSFELLANDELTGGDVLPGFRCTVSRLFRKPAMVAAAKLG